MFRHQYLLRLFGVALMVAGVFVAFRPRMSQFFAADRCLDHGGSDDYARGESDRVMNHPYIPWSKRPHDGIPAFAGGCLAIGGLVVLALERWRSRQKSG